VADISSLLNDLKISMQRQLNDVFIVQNGCFSKKNITLVNARLAEKNLQMFPKVDEYMKEKDVNQQVVALV